MMKRSISFSGIAGRLSVLLLALLFVAQPARAQWAVKWLNIGSFHNLYSEAGGMPEAMGQSMGGMQWPADFRGMNNLRSTAMWVTATNWTDEKGDLYPVKTAHVGPRELGIGQMFPKRFDTIGRFPKPFVTVDGLESFEKPTALDRVEPGLTADRILHNVVNTVTGITVEQKIQAFSQEYHDNYHIVDITLTNTGNVDGDADIELPNQTMTGVYYYETIRHSGPGGDGFGQYAIHKFFTGKESDGLDDLDRPMELRGYFEWPGFLGSIELGQPLIRKHSREVAADTVGRLRSTGFMGKAVLWADQSATLKVHDPNQPTTLASMRDKDGKPHDQYNKQEMADNYVNYVTKGEVLPHHADIVQPPDAKYANWTERFADQTALPHLGVNGISQVWAFGPYTIKPGESVHIVYVHGSSGISTKAALEIGKAYKAGNLWKNGTGGNKGPEISYDANGNGSIEEGEVHTKNEWFMTGRDSLLQSFYRARANFQSNYAIPQPPRPPSEFNVQGGTDRIVLDWKTFDGENPPGGFEIYRARNNWFGDVQDDYEFEKIASVGSTERSYEDTQVSRGINYYYYIQSVGDINTDPTGETPTGIRLKSNRFYTRTYDPAILKRQPGGALSDVRVVPNPFHLGADKNIRWPDKQDKIGFLEIPGHCTIRIYTELGELIRTIEHTDGSGDEYWDMTTRSTQLVVSGVYLAQITDEDTGSRIIRSFVVIR